MLTTNQRIAVLVDAENVEITITQNYKSSGRAKTALSALPEWKKILLEIVGKRTLVRNIYYKKKGLDISEKFRRLWEEDLGGEIKQPIKSVDPYISVDAITFSEKVDTVVLVSGDKDFLPVIWYLKSRGCKVEVAAFDEATSSVLRAAADHYVKLDATHVVHLRRSSSRQARIRESSSRQSPTRQKTRRVLKSKLKE